MEVSLKDQFVVADRRAQLVARKLEAMNKALMQGAGNSPSIDGVCSKLLDHDDVLDAMIDSMWVRHVRACTDRAGAQRPHAITTYPPALRWVMPKRVKEFRYHDSRVSTELTDAALRTLAVEEGVWGSPQTATGSDFLRWCSVALCLEQLNPHYSRILLGIRDDSMSSLDRLRRLFTSGTLRPR